MDGSAKIRVRAIVPGHRRPRKFSDRRELDMEDHLELCERTQVGELDKFTGFRRASSDTYDPKMPVSL